MKSICNSYLFNEEKIEKQSKDGNQKKLKKYHEYIHLIFCLKISSRDNLKRWQRFFDSLTNGVFRFFKFLLVIHSNIVNKYYYIIHLLQCRVNLKYALKRIGLTILTVLFAQSAEARCTGKFVNPITDICWECLFPISIGGAEIFSGSNPDTDNPSLPICFCGTPIPRVGIAAGFWEPVRLVDVTKRPFCFPNLAGAEFDPGMYIGTGAAPQSSGRQTESWHVHYYIYPLIYWLELITDFLCLEQNSFDIAYLTELDPLWSDDSLSYIINPEAALFSNPIAQAACAADCVASSTSGAMDSLFWCGGCQGSLYPMDGNIQGHYGSIQSSLLAAERFVYKLHRQGLAWGTSGEKALCEKYVMPVMKKSQYRSQLTVPVPSDCYPFGKSTGFYESGKEIPITGEDFGFLIWRKRNCCVW